MAVFSWGSGKFGGEGMRILVGHVIVLYFLLYFLLILSLDFLESGERYFFGHHNLARHLLFTECLVFTLFLCLSHFYYPG